MIGIVVKIECVHAPGAIPSQDDENTRQMLEVALNNKHGELLTKLVVDDVKEILRQRKLGGEVLPCTNKGEVN